MIKPSCKTLAAAVLLGALLARPTEAATVTGAGYTNDFAAQPPAADWSTFSLPGATADIDSTTALDAAVQNVASSSFSAQTTSDPANPPAIMANAAWSSTGLYLQTRPTGNGATALMCALENGLGASASAVTVSYDFASVIPASESVSGHRVYYSLTGAAGSWVVIPELSSATPGRVSATISLALPNGGTLYLLWADENGAPSPDAANQIDNFSAALTPATHVPASITAHPQGQTVGELQPVSFSVTAAGNPVPSLQWYTNGVAVAGATSSTLSIASTPLHYSGLAFRAVAQNVASNVSYSVTSTVAALTVNADTIRPVLLGAAPSGLNLVIASFSERLAPASVANVANYSVVGTAGSLTISNAVLDASLTNLILTVTTMAPGSNYVLTVSGVTDPSAAANVILPNSQANFTSAITTFANVGNPATPGSATAVSGGFNITGAGSDIGGTNDQFSFNYQSYAGDFDIKVRVDSITEADAWAKAGLMARENLNGGSRYAAAFASPNIAGTFFQYRLLTAGQTTNAGSFPSTYPNAWLRLRRQGNTFTGFAGVDGNSWMQLGSVTVTTPALPSAMLVGLAVTSKSANQPATAGFRTLADVTGVPTVGSVPLKREPLGPSTRRTGLTISEIMYHPRTVNGLTNRSLEFIEIFNSMAIKEDLSGHRISGAVGYAFPNGTVIKPGQFLVIARDPSFVQSHYGISGVLGPWEGAITNGLPGNEGLIRLRNPADAVMLEVRYRDSGGWPVAADGAGHSLVLSRPSFGEGNVQAWAASDLIDGSPGKPEPFGADALSPVMINEFLAHTDLPQEDFVELYNHSNQPVDLSGAYLSDDPKTNKFRIPNGTTIGARGFVSFNQTQLGFALSASGERLFLVNPSQTRVIDAVDFGPQANGVASGRYPDGSPTISILSALTPGAANARMKIADVVINEIMYSPISGDADDEFIELHNRSGSAVNLGGWRLQDGVTFTFPAGTVIPAGGFLVVGNNATNLLGNYPQLNAANTVGNYSGTLGNGGERIALAFPDYSFTTNTNTLVITTNISHVVVNEVTYGDGGRWGHWSDGGGSSLQLIDPDSDNRQPSNWADSDESAKSPWTNIEITGNSGAVLGTANLLLVYMLGVGECLVDDVEVRVNNGNNLVPNPGFESDFTSWVMLAGSHDQSSIENSAYSGDKSLHIRAGSRGDDSCNSVRTGALTGLGTANITLRAKARWLRGFPELLLRLRGGGLEVAGRLALPKNLGSPGLANPKAIQNAGPAVFDVTHTPALPAASEPVVVTARAIDPDGIASLTLRYRVDTTSRPITTAMYTSLDMKDDGTGGDAVAGDGIYSATLGGQGRGVTVAFYIEAKDAVAGAGQGVNIFPEMLFPQGGLERVFPYDSYSRDCLVRWGDPQPFGAFGTYHLWVTLPTAGRWNDRHEICNTPLDGTFVYNNYRVVYNCRPQFAGSPWHASSMSGGPTNNANRVDYVCNFREDELFLGTTDTVLNTTGNPSTTNDGSDTSAQAEQASYIFFKQMGLQYNYRRYIHMFLNGNQRSVAGNVPGGLAASFIMEDSQQPNSDVIDEWSPDDTDGELYKIEDWFAFSDTGFNAGNEDADLGRRTQVINGRTVMTAAPYRFMWRKRAVGAGESASDYRSLFRLIDAVSPTPAYTETANLPIPDPGALDVIADIEQWMRVFACQHAVGNWDSYGYQRGKNAYTYKPANGRFMQWTWDIDFTMNIGGNGPTQSLFDLGGDGDRRIDGIWNTPVYRRMYLRAFKDLVDGPWNRGFMDPILDEKQAAFIQNGISIVPTTVNTIKSFITDRRNYILGQITNFVNAPFRITGNTEITTSNNLLVVSGTAGVGIKDFLLNGAEYPILWVTPTNWTLRLTLEAGTNAITLTARDRSGNETTNVPLNIIAVFDGVVPSPKGAVIFSEIMYNPQQPDSSYVEIYNSAPVSYDLTGWRVNGLDYTFPVGSIITNGQYLVLAKNRSGFGSVYTNVIPAGQFEGSLDLDGETLTLLQPGGNGAPDVVIDQVRYEPRAPWPTLANGGGPSLQLLDADQDNSRPSNWGDRQGWRRVVYTGIIQGATTSPGTNFLLFMGSAGDVYVDDIEIVTGTQAGVGDNLVVNGGFENPIGATWQISGNHSNSVVSTAISHSGNGSLHIIAAGIGGPSSAIRQFIPPLASNTTCTLSYWYLPSPNGTNLTLRTTPGSLFVSSGSIRPTVATPGQPNSVVETLPAYDPLWLNELQAENTSGPTDNAGQRDPWIELFNAGPGTINLSGYYLANNYDSNLTQWAFPAGSSIAAGEYKIVWADGQPAQTAGTALHTSFRLNAATGSVALVRLVEGSPQVTDYLTYNGLPAGYSYGDFPDGQPFNRVNMTDVTPGTTNVARPVTLFINEWLAGNTNTIADPADGQFEDWFELYNPGTNAVDLGGFWLTDSPGNAGNYFQIPTNGQYIIAPGGFLLVWADNEPGQNSATRPDLHVDFQLSKSGENIALYAPDKRTLVDRVTFAAQIDDISEGRFPDGAPFISVLSAPSPRAANQLGGGNNTPPTLDPIASRTIRLGQTVTFTATADDVDEPAQTLTFDLPFGAPTGVSFNAAGQFSWTPGDAQAPSTNSITVRVTDSGVPAQSASRTVTIIVLLPPSATIGRNGGNISLTFDTTAGRTYQVQFKNDLNAGAWQPLGAAVVAAGPTLGITDSISGQPQRFYRIIQLD